MLVLEVDLLACWNHGRGVFTECLLRLGLVGKLAVIRRSTVLSVRISLITDLLMNAVNWAFLVAMPLPIAAWVGVRRFFIDRMVEIGRIDPFSWIATLVLAALQAASLDIGMIRLVSGQVLGPRRFWTFVGVDLLCLIVSGYRTMVYLLQHPPIAQSWNLTPLLFG